MNESYGPKFWDEVLASNPNYMTSQQEGVGWPSRKWFAGHVGFGKSLLDVGCCNAVELDSLKFHGRNDIAYSGCDFSEKAVELSRLKHPEVDFMVSDARDLKEYGDRSFDVVYVRQVLDPNDGWDLGVISCWRVCGEKLYINQWQMGTEDEQDSAPENGKEGYTVFFNQKRFRDWCMRNLSPVPKSFEVVSMTGEGIPGKERRRDTIYIITKK